MTLCYFLNLASFYLLLSIPVTLSSDPLYYLCSYEANYTTNSSFAANLNLLLASLSSNTRYTGFFNDTKGESPDQAFGLALCRGDLDSYDCQDCLNSSVQGIVQRCPLQKSATIWYDQCLLRYSNKSFFSSVDTVSKLYIRNNGTVSEPKRFTRLIEQFMNDLSKKAAYNSSRMFRIGDVDYTSSASVDGVVQCTRDLSADDCYRCLRSIVQSVPSDGKLELRVLAKSCILGYLVTSNDAATTTPAVDPAPPPASPQRPKSISPVGNTSTDHKKRKSNAIVAVAVIISSLAAIVLLSAILFYLQRGTANRGLNGRDEPELGEADVLIDLDTLRNATNNFSDENKLGQGGFGQVYKGVLSDGQEIAVKRLSNTSRQGLLELRNEVALVAKLYHKNLARLLGCCLEEQEKLLVYEYLPNTSLDNFLSDPIRRKQLDWKKRYKIIEGIARGLLYLHHDSRMKIIHRDLKASNILLDANLNPKISDFGLAKLFDVDKTRDVTRRIAGTFGYMPPEYAMHGQFSTKSDVFSYGMLVLEIVAGRMNSSFRGSGHPVNLLSHVWHHWNKGAAMELKDSSLESGFQAAEVLKCIHIGLLCVQQDPLERPNMSSVVVMLNSYTMTLPVPSAPAFLFGHGPTSDSVQELMVGDLNPNDRTTRASGVASANDVSMSEIEPR